MDLPTLLGRVPWHFLRTPAFLWGAAIASVCFLFGTLLVPLVWVRMPHDYFTREVGRPAAPARVARLALGVPLIAIGVVMIVLPGQGFLTIALGLAVVDFDGKRRLLEQMMVRLRLLKIVNMLRARFGQRPLELHPSASHSTTPQPPGGTP